MKEATLGPTSANRFYSLDVLRGFAVLGILLVNISWFGHLYTGAPGVFTGLPGSEPWMSALMTAFVSNKVIALFGMVLGMGLFLQYRKRKALFSPAPPLPGEPPQHNPHWPVPYVVRILVLGGIGLLSMIFLWEGNALLILAAAALVATLFVGMPWSALKWWLLGLAGLKLFIGLFYTMMFVTQAGFAGEEEVRKYLGLTVLQVFQEGHYLHQVVYRVELLPALFMTLFSLVPVVLFSVLVGMLVVRTGYLEDPPARPDVFRLGIFLCVLVGLPLNILAGWGVYMGVDYFVVLEFFAPPFLSIGLLVLAIRFLRGRQPLLLQPLAKVGKVALSTYLMQTVICTTIFYSWGFGWFGLMTVQQMLTVVVGVWVANVVMAYAWLRFFDIGPVEWAWRSLSEGRKLPWRGSAAGM